MHVYVLSDDCTQNFTRGLIFQVHNGSGIYWVEIITLSGNQNYDDIIILESDFLSFGEIMDNSIVEFSFIDLVTECSHTFVYEFKSCFCCSLIENVQHEVECLSDSLLRIHLDFDLIDTV